MLPAQYKTKLQPEDRDNFALVIKSYFKAFIEISSDIKIPLKPIFFLIISSINFFEKVETFLSQFLSKVYVLS